MLKNYILLSVISLSGLFATAQGSDVFPLNSNPNIKAYLLAHPGYVWGTSTTPSKWEVNDTLDLPFFEDFFTTTEIYPDSNKWVNNKVYINSHFPIKPPSLGVATFDALNAEGNPYNGLAPDFYGVADELTSQPINLDSFTVGPTTNEYKLSDSIYLSFYYQGQGRGDDLRGIDSLILEFKSEGQQWVKVWATGGIPLADFKKAMVLVDQEFYLHKGFQFRFKNFANYKGNVSHWHVDYIYLDKNRTMNDSITRDVTISGLPTSLLRYNSAMPWNQFIADPTREVADSHYFYIHNLHNVTANMEYRHEAKTMGGSSILVNDFNNNNENIFADQELRWGFGKYKFDTMTVTGSPVFVERNYRIKNDLGNPNNGNTDNDQITVRQEFGKYIAYDDGSAELGYGISYGTLPDNAETKVVYKFHLNEPDTLWGISIFFNQSVVSVAEQVFYLQVWQDISVGTPNGTMLHEQFAGTPAYTDSINGFHTYALDTPYILLPAGDFYIGWRQNQRFILNIGFDINYVPDNNAPGNSTKNPNLFENVTGNWKAVSFQVKGAPMIRPVIEYTAPIVSVKKVELAQLQVTIYTNPAQNVLNLDTDQELTYTIRDIMGRVVLEGVTYESIDITQLNSGTYVIQLVNNKKSEYCTKKFIVTK